VPSQNMIRRGRRPMGGEKREMKGEGELPHRIRGKKAEAKKEPKKKKNSLGRATDFCKKECLFRASGKNVNGKGT